MGFTAFAESGNLSRKPIERNTATHSRMGTNFFNCAKHTELNDPFDLKFQLSDEFILTINER